MRLSALPAAVVCVLWLAVFITPLSAQISEGWWVGWNSQTGVGCDLCAYSPEGTVLSSVNLAQPGPSVVAKHPTGGMVFAPDSASGTLNAYILGTPNATLSFAVTGQVQDIAINALGRVTLLATQGASTLLETRDLNGVSLNQRFVTSMVPQCMSMGPDQSTWVLSSHAPASIQRMTAAGDLDPEITLTSWPYLPRSMEVDARGRVFVLISASGGGASQILRYDPAVGGAATVLVAQNDMRAMGLDGRGFLRVLVGNQAPQTVQYLDPETGGARGQWNADPSEVFSDLALDALGRVWLTHGGGAGLAAYTPLGSPLAAVGPGILNTSRGDPGGLHYVSVVDRFSDSDGDNFSNESELQRGTDPTDPASRPPALSMLSVPALGSSFTVMAIDRVSAGGVFAVAGSAQGIPLGDGRVLPLANDSYFSWWMQSGGNQITNGIVRTLTTPFQTLTVYPSPVPLQTTVVMAWIGWDAQGLVSAISDPLTVSIP